MHEHHFTIWLVFLFFTTLTKEFKKMIGQKIRCDILIPYNLRVEAKELGISISRVTTDALKNAIDAKKLELI
ncbi:MAG: hypothetical protein M0P20_02180 [Methanocorpusculum sp.]|jgi:post-segregation antitoxin (ccd killing protein)|nr:hypothetical protein [Methanocorpusculum sp.]